jgi:hypothetical protein
MGFSRAPSYFRPSPRKSEIARIWATTIAAEPCRLLGELARLARANRIFAFSEISKGLAILTIGDMVIAEGVGEFVCIAALTIDALPFIRFRSAAQTG